MLQQLAGVRDDAIVEVGLQDGDPLVTVGSATLMWWSLRR
jgi:hypothetical protein